MADTAVAEAKTTAVANIMDDLYASAGQGMETIGADDMQIPFSTDSTAAVTATFEDRL